MIAAELGIRSATVWHRWICAYDPEYAQYSPGVILGVEMAKAAAAEGISHLDLGKDSTFYKQSFMTATIPIAEGFVERPSLVTAARHARRDLEAWVRRSPFANIARIPGRWLTRYERSSRFR
jgi:CelD/BcsL family acetyltransferase involved in cellulose biosynthesis